MKLTKERKEHLRYCDLQRSHKNLLDNLQYLPLLIQFVSPAKVYHARDLDLSKSPTINGFAKSHNYDQGRLLKLLRREKVLHKMSGTWMWAKEYRDRNFVFYTVGHLNKYGSLDMYLLPDGIRFLEDFIAAHPIKHRVKRNE